MAVSVPWGAVEMSPLWKSAHHADSHKGFGTRRVPHSHSDHPHHRSTFFLHTLPTRHNYRARCIEHEIPRLDRQVALNASGFVTSRPARPVRSLRIRLQQLVGHPLLVALLVTSFLVGCSETSPSDNSDTPRGLRLNTTEVKDGYVLFSPLLSDTTYLVATASGEVVHTWKSDYAPSGFVYLLDNGHLWR